MTTKVIPEPYHTLDLRSYLYDSKLHSRLIWQVLFDAYRNSGGELDHMDSMLCDLYSLERWLQALPRGGAVLYWLCRPYSWYTSISNFRPFEACIQIKVDPTRKQVAFTRLPEQGVDE